jgi:hypothetical protein
MVGDPREGPEGRRGNVNRNSLRAMYEALTPEERFRLSLEAAAHGDQRECLYPVQSCPRVEGVGTGAVVHELVPDRRRQDQAGLRSPSGAVVHELVPDRVSNSRWAPERIRAMYFSVARFEVSIQGVIPWKSAGREGVLRNRV